MAREKRESGEVGGREGEGKQENGRVGMRGASPLLTLYRSTGRK